MSTESCSSLPIFRIDEGKAISKDCHADQAARKMYEDAANGTAKITADGASGSGFFVEDGSRIVTNFHVVRDYRYLLSVTAHDGTRYKARVEKIDDINDLAVLKLEKGARHSMALELRSSTLDMKNGDLGFGIGHPRASSQTYISPGYFENRIALGDADKLIKEKNEDLKKAFDKAAAADGEKSKADSLDYLKSERFQLRLSGEPGSSGSAIVDQDKKVFAVITNGPPGESMKGHLWAVPSESVVNLLKNDSKFVLTYENKPFAMVDPADFFIVGSFATGLSMGFPRTGGSLMAGIGLMTMPTALDRITNAKTSIEQAEGYVGLLSGTSFTAGAALSFVNRSMGRVGLAIGAGALIASAFFPTTTYLTEIRRKDGDTRQPFWWKRD